MEKGANKNFSLAVAGMAGLMALTAGTIIGVTYKDGKYLLVIISVLTFIGLTGGYAASNAFLMAKPAES